MCQDSARYQEPQMNKTMSFQVLTTIDVSNYASIWLWEPDSEWAMIHFR